LNVAVNSVRHVNGTFTFVAVITPVSSSYNALTETPVFGVKVPLLHIGSVPIVPAVCGIVTITQSSSSATVFVTVHVLVALAHGPLASLEHSLRNHNAALNVTEWLHAAELTVGITVINWGKKYVRERVPPVVVHCDLGDVPMNVNVGHVTVVEPNTKVELVLTAVNLVKAGAHKSMDVVPVSAASTIADPMPSAVSAPSTMIMTVFLVLDICFDHSFDCVSGGAAAAAAGHH
jgi:hypothetical protein